MEGAGHGGQLLAGEEPEDGGGVGEGPAGDDGGAQARGRPRDGRPGLGLGSLLLPRQREPLPRGPSGMEGIPSRGRVWGRREAPRPPRHRRERPPPPATPAPLHTGAGAGGREAVGLGGGQRFVHRPKGHGADGRTQLNGRDGGKLPPPLSLSPSPLSPPPRVGPGRGGEAGRAEEVAAEEGDDVPARPGGPTPIAREAPPEPRCHRPRGHAKESVVANHRAAGFTVGAKGGWGGAGLQKRATEVRANILTSLWCST